MPAEIAARIELRWQQAYQAQDEADLCELYEEWAGTYDEDHHAVGCFHHDTAAELLAGHLADRQAAILDAGAGTGLTGQSLQNLGYRNLFAVDFSPSSLQVAADKGLYRRAWVRNLNRPLAGIATGRFEAVIAVGVFSYGQVQVQALDELVRVTRPGGLIAFTQRVDFHESNAMGFQARQAELEAGGDWELVDITAPKQYLPRKEPQALFRAWLYKKI